MNYNFNGKNIRIPDSDIQRSMEHLQISQEEAIQVWLEDEGYLENPEQEELEQKAKENRITATIHQASAKDPRKKTQKERVQKDDPTKEYLIKEIKDLLERLQCENVKIENKSKYVSFELDGDKYEVNLIRHRKPKEKSESAF